MRILLSAYACEPDKGSEPAVGWNWAIHLARRGHQVCVITRSNNRASIEKALLGCPEATNLHFVYYDLSPRLQRWKKRWLGVHAYYGLWQRGAARLAEGMNAKRRFDLVHHVTFVGVRQPSYMWRLGIPFILGPVAGGERAPLALRRHFSLKSWLADLGRDAVNLAARFNPALLKSLAAAEKIFVTSEQTKDVIPRRYHDKTHVQLAIGLSEREMAGFAEMAPHASAHGLRILYVGRFVDLKGMGLAIPAFASFSKRFPEAELTLVGTGPERGKWQEIADELGVSQKVHWIEWVPREEMARIYENYDVLLFPSLRDSGGMVVLEAMARGLPVISLDLGGPSVMVNASCGIKIPTDGQSENEVVSALAEAFQRIADPVCRKSLSEAARSRPRVFLWDSLVDRVYESRTIGPARAPSPLEEAT